MRRPLTIAAALIAAVGLALTPATGLAAKTKTVKVKDDYFTSTKVNVKKNAKVKFKWDGMNVHIHNVTLKKGPKGVKKSKPCQHGKITECNVSGSGAVDIKFTPTFNKAGTYDFFCTVHPTTMKTKVVVKK